MTQHFCQNRLQRIETGLRPFIDEGKLPGMILTVGHADDIVYQQCLGYMDIESKRDMEVDAIFRIASMTKPITSAALMTLYEQGHFNLNTPVHEFIPSFKDVQVCVGEHNGELVLEPLAHPMTMRHLFTHTSGLSYGWNQDDPVDREYRKLQEANGEAMRDTTLEAMVNVLTQAPLAFHPGTHWRYSLAIDVLGYIIEVISGKTLDAYMQETIFGPLGMVDTGFWIPEAKRSRLATLYGHPNGAEDLTLMQKPADFEGVKRPSFLSGGGGLLSTARDYARFAQMMANGGTLEGTRILGPTTMALYSMNLAPKQALPYGFSDYDLHHMGYGYSLGTRVLMDPAANGQFGSVGEFGWDGAFNTYFWVNPVLRIYGVMMMQHSPNNYFPVADKFKQLTYQAYIG